MASKQTPASSNARVIELSCNRPRLSASGRDVISASRCCSGDDARETGQARPNRKGNSIALENYGKLLSEVCWSSLVMQSVKKRVLLQRIAGPQQFEEGVL